MNQWHRKAMIRSMRLGSRAASNEPPDFFESGGGRRSMLGRWSPSAPVVRGVG